VPNVSSESTRPFSGLFLHVLIQREAVVNPFKYLYRGALAGAVLCILLYMLLAWIYL